MNCEPAGLGERGSRVYRSLTEGEENPLIIETAIEAARAADRLDDLDRAIQGEGVLDLMRAALEDNGITNSELKISIKLSFAGVLMEGRHQQDNYRKLLAEVGRLKAAAGTLKGQDKGYAQPEPAVQATVDDELARRRREREAARKSG